MRLLLLIITAVAAYFVWQQMQAQQENAEETPLGGQVCSEVELSATADPTDRDGKPWDLTSPPDLAFQVGSATTEVCHESHTCTHLLTLEIPTRRFEMQLWDIDEDDRQLISSGWFRVDGPEARIGAAKFTVRCLNWVDQ